MRIAILWIQLTGYLNSCLLELASRPGVELFIVHTRIDNDSPFDHRDFDWLDRQLIWRTQRDLGSIDERLEEFCPDIIIFAGWTVPAYRRVAMLWKSRATRIMTMDNCWNGTITQRLGCLMSPFYVRRLADIIWVPGERQVRFAQNLKFRKDCILRGLYSCNHLAFRSVYETRLTNNLPISKNFIFVGRMVEEKGIETLISAYRRYRNIVESPWPLVCYGRGYYSSKLKNEQGIEVEDFIQPELLPHKMAQAACLLLPSVFEPWALVVHEATSAGLIILASRAVGSVPHLVQVGQNGFVFDVGDAEELSRLMVRIGDMSDANLKYMSAASVSTSQQFTPSRWADSVLTSAKHNQDTEFIIQ